MSRFFSKIIEENGFYLCDKSARKSSLCGLILRVERKESGLCTIDLQRINLEIMPIMQKARHVLVCQVNVSDV